MRWKTKKLAIGDHVEIFNDNGSNGTGKVLAASDNQVTIIPDPDNTVFNKTVSLPKSISRFYEKARYHFSILTENVTVPNRIYAWGGYYRQHLQDEFVFRLITSGRPPRIYVYRDFEEFRQSDRLFEHHSFPYMIDTKTWKATVLAEGTLDSYSQGGNAVVGSSDQEQLKQQGIV